MTSESLSGRLSGLMPQGSPLKPPTEVRTGGLDRGGQGKGLKGRIDGNGVKFYQT